MRQKTIEAMAAEIGVAAWCSCDAPSCLGGECDHECERQDRHEQFIREQYDATHSQEQR